MSDELREGYLQLIRGINAQLERDLRPINELHERIAALLHKLAERR